MYITPTPFLVHSFVPFHTHHIRVSDFVDLWVNLDFFKVYDPLQMQYVKIK